MASLVDIYNMALTSVGSRRLVSLPTEDSKEAEICNLWYPNVRDQVLRSAFWPSTRAVSRLALVVERDVDAAWVSSDPEPGWRYAYSAPSDLLSPRYLTTFERFALTSSSDNSRLIVTNMEDAVLVYTKQQTNIGAWDVELRMAIVHALAAQIAMPVNAKPERAKMAQDQANQLIIQARVDAANASQEQFETVPDWITARGYAGAQPQYRYIYEYGPLVAVTDGIPVT